MKLNIWELLWILLVLSALDLFVVKVFIQGIDLLGLVILLILIIAVFSTKKSQRKLSIG